MWFPVARSVRTGRAWFFFCICCHPPKTTWVGLKMMGTPKSMVIPLLNHNVHIQIVSGWWFGTFFIFHNIWDFHPSHWRTHILQDGYCTTNQDLFGNFQGDTLYQPNPHKKDILKWAHCYPKKNFSGFGRQVQARAGPHPAYPAHPTHPPGFLIDPWGITLRQWEIQIEVDRWESHPWKKTSHCHGWLPEANHVMR